MIYILKFDIMEIFHHKNIVLEELKVTRARLNNYTLRIRDSRSVSELFFFIIAVVIICFKLYGLYLYLIYNKI